MNNQEPLLLAINPGGTSTKVAVFQGETPLFTESLSHSPEDLAEYKDVWEQHQFRRETILALLDKHNISLSSLSAVVGRGGLVRPIEGGTYLVNQDMLRDLKRGVSGHHPSNLAAQIAYDIASVYQIPAFVVDPVVVDELQDLARVSGFPKIERRSVFHALNHKAVARKVARELDKDYSELNLIIVHGGSGISIGAHQRGRVVDVNNALDGDGPMAPERAGTLPTTAVVALALSGDFTEKELLTRFSRNGGLMSYLGTNDGREVQRRINTGDAEARFYFEAMCYTVAKEVGRMAAALSGKVDAIVLTAGLAYNSRFVELVTERVQWIGRVIVRPGENEMESLALGGLMALKDRDAVKYYKSQDIN